MPRQRTDHSRRVYVFPDDFPGRLKRFMKESRLTWAEIARRIETYPLTIRRWRSEGVRPNQRYLTALLDLADSLDLGHVFTDWVPRCATRSGAAGSARRVVRRAQRFPRPNAPPRRGSSGIRKRVDEASVARR